MSCIIIFRSDLRHIATDILYPFPPTPQQYIYFYLNDPIRAQKNGEDTFQEKSSSITVGPQLTRVNLNLGKDHFMLGVVLHPGALYRLLAIPMTEMFDQDIDSDMLFGSEINIVYEQLKYAQTWVDMKNVVEAFLLKKAALLKPILPFDHAIRELMKQHGNLSIDQAAAISCLSIRQFERKCMERIGLPPKLFARLVRFSRAYHLKETQQQLNWTSIAHASGYYDQMHFVRDFKAFAGVTPSFIQQELETAPLRLRGGVQ